MMPHGNVAFVLALLMIVEGGASGQSAGKPQHRIIPIHPMTEDVEVLYGDPEKPGEPFVMRIRELFGWTPEAAIVQVHGVGPFHIHWRDGAAWRDRLKTLDDPDAASVFKFKKGQAVVARRGRGRIRQGYDSGEMIGYEIDGDDGILFAAEERDLSPAGKQ